MKKDILTPQEIARRDAQEHGAEGTVWNPNDLLINQPGGGKGLYYKPKTDEVLQTIAGGNNVRGSLTTVQPVRKR